MKKSIFFIRLTPLLLSVVLCGCKKQHHTPQQQAVPRMDVVEVTRENVYQRMTFTSRLSANSEVVIQPRVSGYLLAKHYEKGRPVRKGQLLYEIDPSQLNLNVLSDQASLEAARVSLLEAEKNYERAIPLAELAAISQSALDQYRASFASAQAQVRMAEAALRNSQINLQYSKIYAPISGIIGETAASVGDYVGAGTQFSTLSTISDTEKVTAEISLPMATYYAIRNVEFGAEPTYDNDTLLSDIRLILDDGVVYPYAGKYSYTEKDVGSQSGAIVLVVEFPNPDGTLKAGQYASVSANVGSRAGALLVPQQAVSQVQNVNSVWVVRPDSTLEYRPVVLGDTFGTMWIVRQGVNAGERVLVSGQMKARNGAKIEPVMSGVAL